MTIIETGPHTTNYLVYNAPVNEKTEKIRELFKIDKETGYPEHYKWRNMARLGPQYKPEDPYLKFDGFKEEEYYSTKVFMVSAFGAGAAFFHWIWAYSSGRPFYSKAYIPLGIWGAISYGVNKYVDYKLTRQGIRNAIIIDYTRQHPERFGEIKRYKIRECLFDYRAVR